MQNEQISLLLILVDPESTVCPGKGRVSRTSYSKSTICPEEGGVLRTSYSKSITYPDKRGVGSPGQTRTVVLRTNVA